MVSLCFYFQVHQPFRLRKNYSFFDIGTNHLYEDDAENRAICNKVAEKCYIPMNTLLLELIERYQGKFKVSFSISGCALDQFEKYNPKVLELFQKLAKTGCVEFINETYYHSLSFIFSKDEFKQQALLHRNRVRELFNQTPATFRNTELIYNNDVARLVEELGYRTILAEGADQVLGWRTPNFMYQPVGCYKLNLLMKNYKLSDDIAFRFSNRGWEQWPLSAEKYASWLHSISGNGELINLFMDYETFGEHQWADTGIFNFMRALPAAVLKHPDYHFITPREAHLHYTPVSKIDCPHFMSWADVERDLTAWLGNPLQNSAIEMAYSLEKRVKKSKDPDLVNVWRKLLTSDHFYYMCTKWFSDGDVHKYFNPYESPYDAYVVYMNILNDLMETLKQRGI
ncbi:MAG: alpha-amylase [Candidatus Raymondbacteria bacterium RIFOXYA2_FULL_49_16]|nr:MAG: alpha-amylase [Candidatus Raymondbacteria bacterium RIFOXYA2_FULL_49_16]OGP43033.1 MAG: alpha-amylase [Candidatus Raymondbacteria bacterium RIFOXYB2_FULL_49_35]